MSIFQLFKPELEVEWNSTQKFILRTLSVFFVILSVPLDWKYFRDLYALDWTGFNYGVLFEITRYFPRVVGEVPVLFDVFLVLGFSLISSWVWSRVEKSEPNWDALYKVLRILVRYRLAAALLAYAYIKIFPIQSPYPSITLLNTAYGDLSACKIFSLSLGIVPDYQTFLGLFELLAALLLLNRKTASIGAFIAILFLGNVAMSNPAYEGGEFVYSGVLVLFATFTFLHTWPKFYTLLFLRKRTVPETYSRPLASRISATTSLAIKYSFILVFVVGYGVLVYVGYANELTKYPNSQGLEGLAGVYDVQEFVVNGDTIPYRDDAGSKRWNRVVFEEWATLAIETDEEQIVDFANTEYIGVSNQTRLYETQGIQGWKFYEYDYSEDKKTLSLVNRNPDYSHETLQINLLSAVDGRLEVAGKDSYGNDFQAVLIRNTTKYLLQEAKNAGRRGKLIL
jgi:hypothetical protein